MQAMFSWHGRCIKTMNTFKYTIKLHYIRIEVTINFDIYAVVRKIKTSKTKTQELFFVFHFFRAHSFSNFPLVITKTKTTLKLEEIKEICQDYEI